MSLRRRTLIVIAWNVGVFAALLAGLELYLRATDPANNLPYNGRRDGISYTWGHQVSANRLGFRGGEPTELKPDRSYRVMVLGDSLTWGAGLAVEERYTNLAQASLAAMYPHRAVEILNFGVAGGPTTQQRDILLRYAPRLQPDRIVVGFCFNDPQPREQTFSHERQRFDEGIGALITSATQLLAGVALVEVAKLTKKGVYRGAQWFGVFPAWPVALQRVYMGDSLEWIAFRKALRDIVSSTRSWGIAPPIFLVLNQAAHKDRPANYLNPDSRTAILRGWYRQAEGLAAEVGFVTANHEEEISALEPGTPLVVNELDGHPSAVLNRIYAEKLVELLAPDLRRDMAHPHPR